jgi:hypothetical protein
MCENFNTFLLGMLKILPQANESYSNHNVMLILMVVTNYLFKTDMVCKFTFDYTIIVI